MDINLNLNQLKFIRGVLSLKRMYKPYEERGDTNVPKGVLWNDDLEDLFIQVEAAIQRQSPNCPPWSPFGSFPTIIEESKKLNLKMTGQLTKEDFDLIAQVFSSAASLDIDTRLVEDGDTTHDHFSSVWDKVIDRGN